MCEVKKSHGRKTGWYWAGMVLLTISGLFWLFMLVGMVAEPSDALTLLSKECQKQLCSRRRWLALHTVLIWLFLAAVMAAEPKVASKLVLLGMAGTVIPIVAGTGLLVGTFRWSRTAGSFAGEFTVFCIGGVCTVLLSCFLAAEPSDVIVLTFIGLGLSAVATGIGLLFMNGVLRDRTRDRFCERLRAIGVSAEML